MKKLQNREIIIPIDLLDFVVKVRFTTDIHKWFKKNKDQFSIDIDPDYNAVCFAKPGHALILFPNNPSISLVSHEVYHAVERVLENRGLDDEELGAIIMEHIMNIIYEGK